MKKDVSNTLKTTTTNYELIKPGQDDFYNIDEFNQNMDIIDENIKKLYDTKAQKNNADFTGSMTLNGKDIATTYKTEILFTPEPDVKISYNNSYKINNTMFFRLTFEKSDGSYFEANEKAMKLCTSSISVGIGSGMALPLSTSVYDDNGNPIPCSSCSISNTILYIPSIPNKCRRIQISGVSVI